MLPATLNLPWCTGTMMSVLTWHWIVCSRCEHGKISHVVNMKTETARGHQHRFRTHRSIASYNIGRRVQPRSGAVEVETGFTVHGYAQSLKSSCPSVHGHGMKILSNQGGIHRKLSSVNRCRIALRAVTMLTQCKGYQTTVN